MTASRLLYIQRADRGARVDTLRLVGVRVDHAWSAPDAERDPAAVASAGADWAREQLNGSGRELSAVCLDTDGAVCTWLHSPAGDPSVARLLVADAQRQSGVVEHEDEAQALATQRFPGIDGESSVHPIRPPTGGDAERLPVLVMPDPAARLVLDELDRRRVVTQSVCSLWHAIAWAWDAPPTTTSSDDRMVADSAPCVGTVVIDPRGRAVWTWSCAGRLIAGGTVRLRGAPGDAHLAGDDIPRLANDWLGWASQLGVTPQRVTIVGRFESDDPDATPSDAGEVGRAFSARWPGTPADLVHEPDPIAETLKRAAERFEDGPSPAGTESDTVLPELSTRPTRAHRGMYVWSGVSMALAGVVLLVGAWLVRSHSTGLEEQTRELRAERRTLLEAIDQSGAFNPPLALDPFAASTLEGAVNRLRSSSQSQNLEAPRPILAGLESITMVVGGAGVVMDEISLSRQIVVLKVTVPDTQTAEDLLAGLRGLASEISWTNSTFARSVRRDDEDWGQWTFTGQWSTGLGPAGGEGGT